jgi:Holliday junction resolvase
MLERDFVKKLVKELKLIPNIWFFKTQELSVRGVPDLLGCLGGTLFALECKRSEKARVTELQRVTLLKINEAGGFASIISPETKDIIIKKLKIYCNHGINML